MLLPRSLANALFKAGNMKRRIVHDRRPYSMLGRLSLWILPYFLVVSCSLTPQLSVVADDAVEQLVKDEAARILAVTPARYNASRYQFYLSDFPRADILGMSIGQGKIYISYKLGRRALRGERHLWLLRQTLAHEIAHEISGHAAQVSFNRSLNGSGITSRDVGLPWYVKFRSYSLEKELQADFEGMKYWHRLGWDCLIWVRILQDFERQNYAGDVAHPTGTRLEQASRACLAEADI